MAKSTAIMAPNYGLYLDKPSLDIPAKALQDGLNFRIKAGVINNLNLGWSKFSDAWTLDGPVTFIDNFFPINEDEKLIFGTTRDIYVYEPSGDFVTFLTPVYVVGTASSAVDTVTGVGTSWLANAKIGDFISFGSATEDDPNADWFEITNVVNDTTITAPGVGAHAAGPYTLRQVFSGTLDDIWSFDTFVQDAVSGDDLWFGTNGIQPVLTWNGSDQFMLSHPELGFTCKVLTTYSNMMIYQNLTQAGQVLPTSIINSNISEPLNVSSGVSEQFRIHDGTDEILNSLPLGDNLVFYCERHIVLCQFVGDPLIFIFRSAIAGLGPIGYNAIADFGDFHEFVGSDAQYSFDGVSVREINSQVWREVIRQVDPLRKKHIYAHFDEENGDLIWSVPSTTDAASGDFEGPPEIAWPEHYLEEVDDEISTPYSKRQFPFTATGYYEKAEGLTWANAVGTWDDFNYSWNDQFNALGFPINLAGDINGQIFVINTDQLADGVLLPSYVRTGRFPVSDGIIRGLLERVYPFAAQTSQTLNIRIWLSDFAAGPATDGGTYPFDTTLLEGIFFVSVFRRARYIEIEFSTTGVQWEIWGWDTSVKSGGRR